MGMTILSRIRDVLFKIRAGGEGLAPEAGSKSGKFKYKLGFVVFNGRTTREDI